MTNRQIKDVRPTEENSIMVSRGGRFHRTDKGAALGKIALRPNRPRRRNQANNQRRGHYAREGPHQVRACTPSATIANFGWKHKES